MNVTFHDLTQSLHPYTAVWEMQQTLHDALLAVKKGNTIAFPSLANTHHLILVEHPHVYTLGKSGSMSNLLLTEAELEERGASFLKVNRGGDITYHGPGQLVGYLVFDMEQLFTDVGRLIRSVEEVAIRTIAEFGIIGYRIKEEPGVWVKNSDEEDEITPPRKICAVGMHLSKWVTMHGFALNVEPDLNYFNYIVPCGITDKGVTSISAELGKNIHIDDVKPRLLHHFAEVFGVVFN